MGPTVTQVLPPSLELMSCRVAGFAGSGLMTAQTSWLFNANSCCTVPVPWNCFFQVLPPSSVREIQPIPPVQPIFASARRTAVTLPVVFVKVPELPGAVEAEGDALPAAEAVGVALG